MQRASFAGAVDTGIGNDKGFAEFKMGRYATAATI
jgi:hypothetical protein